MTLKNDILRFWGTLSAPLVDPPGYSDGAPRGGRSVYPPTGPFAPVAPGMETPGLALWRRKAGPDQVH